MRKNRQREREKEREERDGETEKMQGNGKQTFLSRRRPAIRSIDSLVTQLMLAVPASATLSITWMRTCSREVRQRRDR
jgi:hypothetical protein